MKLLPFFITVFLIAQAGEAQKAEWSGEHDFQNITKHVYYLQDTENKITAEELAAGKFGDLFLLWDKPILRLGYNEYPHWLRIQVTNKTDDSLLIELEHAFIPNADLYFKNNMGEWMTYRSGYKVDLEDKIIKDHNQLFPILPGDNSYFIKLIPYVHPIPIKLWNKNAYYENENRQRIIYGIYTGILLFTVIVNLFLFFALKRVYYLQYAILIFLYLISASSVMEGYIIYFFPNIDLMYFYKIAPVLNMPVLLIYCSTVLDLKSIRPKLHRFILSISAYFVIHIIMLHFIPLIPALIINYIYALIVFILAIYIGVVVGRSGNKLGYFFVFAYSVWFILLFLELLYIKNAKPVHIFELSYVSLAIFIETFLLAVLLVKRFQWEKRADLKSRLDLEAKFQKELLQSQLEIQEQTFKNISQEIHDNIGQALTLAKLNLNTLPSNRETEKITTTRELVSKAIVDLRDLSRSLNTDYVARVGLQMAIQNELSMIDKTGAIKTILSVKGNAYPLDDQKVLILFRIVQEILNNAIKHSEAGMLSVIIEYGEKFSLVIRDDGKGFDTGIAEENANSGIGLRNISNRAKLIGATLQVNSTPRKGTEIIISFSKSVV